MQPVELGEALEGRLARGRRGLAKAVAGDDGLGVFVAPGVARHRFQELRKLVEHDGAAGVRTAMAAAKPPQPLKAGRHGGHAPVKAEVGAEDHGLRQYAAFVRMAG